MNITAQKARAMLAWQQVYSGELGTDDEDILLIKELVECFKDCQELYHEDDVITYHQMYEQHRNYTFVEYYDKPLGLTL